MSSENGEDVFSEMEKVIDQKYAYLQAKNNALHDAEMAKADNVADLTTEVDLLQADFDRIVKSHKSYLAFKKTITATGKKVTHDKDTEDFFRKTVSEMKSNSMGSIVATIPVS